MNILISEYAKKYEITESAVYNRIRRGNLKTVMVDNVKMVIDDGDSVTRKSAKRNSSADSDISDSLAKELDALKQEIAELRGKIESMSIKNQAIDFYREIVKFILKFFKK